MLLVEKRDGRIKAGMCTGGSIQQDWMEWKETTSPTAMTESIVLTAVIDAEEGRDVVIIDVPHAFVQTPISEKQPDDQIIMNIRGVLVVMLIKLEQETYKDNTSMRVSPRSYMSCAQGNLWHVAISTAILQDAM